MVAVAPDQSVEEVVQADCVVVLSSEPPDSAGLHLHQLLQSVGKLQSLHGFHLDKPRVLLVYFLQLLVSFHPGLIITVSSHADQIWHTLKSYKTFENLSLTHVTPTYRYCEVIT